MKTEQIIWLLSGLLIIAGIAVLVLIVHTARQEGAMREHLVMLHEDMENMQVELNALTDPDGGAFRLQR